MNIIVNEAPCFATISLGLRGENEATTITFDVTALAEKYGAGNASVLVKRNGDTTAYPVTATQDGNLITWVVSSVDTAIEGKGECEIWYYVDEVLAKTVVFQTVVRPDIGGSALPPDPFEDYLEEITEIGTQVQHDAAEAKEAAQEAKAATVHAPTIINDYWYIWQNGEYVNTGIRANADMAFSGSALVINT